MITITWTDGFGHQTIRIAVEPMSDGSYVITRTGAFSSRNYVVAGHDSERIAAILGLMPGPAGTNDLANLLYDGPVLEIEHEDSTNKTLLALSLPNRIRAAAWIESFEDVLRTIETPNKSSLPTGRSSTVTPSITPT